MNYIECPDQYHGRGNSLFIAGGISQCRPWQLELVDLLKNTSLILLNPRRKNYDILEEGIEEAQIQWEFEHLYKARAVSFWFPPETLCPITLYELGRQNAGSKTVFIGIDPRYTRKRDVYIQTSLARPDIGIVYSLRDLADQIKTWEKSNC